MTAKQMKKRKPINESLLIDIEPLTHNQKALFDAYDKGQNIVCLLYTSPSPRDLSTSRMPSSA